MIGAFLVVRWETMAGLDNLCTLTRDVAEACDGLLNGAAGELNEMQQDDITMVRRNAARLLTTLETLPPVDGLDEEGRKTLRHDLRNRVNSITGFSRIMLMEMEESAPDALRAHVQHIHETGQALLDEITALLG